MHEQKEFFDWCSLKNNSEIKNNFIKEKENLIEYFHRPYKKIWDFGPSPVIWSCKVWQLLEEQYMKKMLLTLEDLIQINPSEFTWYGESLLYFKPFEILPIGPIFKVFHYYEQYLDSKKDGCTEETFKDNYFGIVIQSNFKKDDLLKY
jgi:hypothetical protein